MFVLIGRLNQEQRRVADAQGWMGTQYRTDARIHAQLDRTQQLVEVPSGHHWVVIESAGSEELLQSASPIQGRWGHACCDGTH